MTWPIAICLAVGGVLVGRLWSDIANAYKYARAADRDSLQVSAHKSLQDLIPMWIIAFVITTGIVTVVIGAAQLWQAHQFSQYQSCQATHDTEYDKAQQTRAAANNELQRKRFEYDRAVLDLFDPKNNDEDTKVVQQKLQAYIEAATKYFNSVEDNPYPESTAKVCGTPKG